MQQALAFVARGSGCRELRAKADLFVAATSTNPAEVVLALCHKIGKDGGTRVQSESNRDH